MIIRHFLAEDYFEADLVNGVGLQHWNLVTGVIPMLQFMQKTRTFFTVIHGGKVLLIAGWHSAWDGVCEVSLFPTHSFVCNPFLAYRHLRHGLRALTKKHRRVQLHCRNEELFVSFAKRLGFEVEGEMKKFSHDGTSHLMMAIVR